MTTLDEVVRFLESEGWSNSAAGGEGHEWLFRDFADEGERKRFKADAEATLTKAESRWPTGFAFRTNDEDSMYDPEGSGTVYIDVWTDEADPWPNETRRWRQRRLSAPQANKEGDKL